MKLKYCFLIFILIVCCFMLSGCYDASGIETLAYVVAIGIDKGNNDNIKLTLQFATLNDSGGSEGSSSQSTSSTTTSVECNTIDSGINLINSYISKKVNLSHCKAIIISEELAKEGINSEILTLVSNIEVRPNCNVIVTKCDASDFIKHLKLTLEAASIKYYELTFNSSEYAGYTEDVTLSDFYTNILSTTTEAVAILGGINAGTAIDNPSEDYKAAETPIVAENNVECMGLAVFKDDKFVGELSNIQTLCHLIVSNKLKEATVTIENPNEINSNLSLRILLSNPTDNDVKLINGTPYITSNIHIAAQVVSFDENLDLSNQQQLEELEELLSNYLENNILDYLYTTSKKYKTDIDGFGKKLLPKLITWDKWLNLDWHGNYESSFFSVSVSSNVESGFLYDKV